MPASTSGTKSPFCINTNQFFNLYHSAAPTTHIPGWVYFSAATPATASTTAVAFHQHNYFHYVITTNNTLNCEYYHST